MALRGTLFYVLTLAVVLTMAWVFSANAATLGYGEFVGEFSGNPSQIGDDGVEDLMVATGDARFADLGTDRQLDKAGKWDGGTSASSSNGVFTNYTDRGMTFSFPNQNNFPGAYKNGEPIFGVWTYNGFEPGVGPGDDPIDLFLAVKYSNRFSVFFYNEVNPGDFGFFTSDPRLIAGVGPCANGVTGECMTMNIIGGKGKKKNKSIKLSPYGLSNVTGYWPPVDATAAVPLPPSVLFLMTAIFALGGVAGIRRIER